MGPADLLDSLWSLLSTWGQLSGLLSFPRMPDLSRLLVVTHNPLPRPAGLMASSLHGDRLLTFCPLLLYTSTLSTRIFHSADSVHLVPNQCPPYRWQWTHMYTYKIMPSFRLPCHLRAGVQQINKRDQSNKRDAVLDSACWFWEADIILGWLSC